MFFLKQKVYALMGYRIACIKIIQIEECHTQYLVGNEEKTLHTHTITGYTKRGKRWLVKSENVFHTKEQAKLARKISILGHKRQEAIIKLNQYNLTLYKEFPNGRTTSKKTNA